jgi:hypothetical protein
MSQNRSSTDQHTVLADAWGHVVGGMEWLQSVIYGEFSDHRSLSAVVADMLVSFVPGVVIVTSARDAVAVILRLATHPEKREDLMEWALLCACLIVIALPIAMAIGGVAAGGVGAIVGGVAGTEIGAGLRAVMLMLIKETSKLVELVLFLQKFMKGDILKFLRSIKFAKYDKALLHAFSKICGKLVDIIILILFKRRFSSWPSGKRSSTMFSKMRSDKYRGLLRSLMRGWGRYWPKLGRKKRIQ